MKKIPNPGSEKAVKAGCLCPVLDNAHGAGCGWKNNEGGPLFWISDACPLHGKEKPDGNEAA
jgi:hypothetical protein